MKKLERIKRRMYHVDDLDTNFVIFQGFMEKWGISLPEMGDIIEKCSLASFSIENREDINEYGLPGVLIYIIEPYILKQGGTLDYEGITKDEGEETKENENEQTEENEEDRVTFCFYRMVFHKKLVKYCKRKYKVSLDGAFRVLYHTETMQALWDKSTNYYRKSIRELKREVRLELENKID